MKIINFDVHLSFDNAAIEKHLKRVEKQKLQAVARKAMFLARDSMKRKPAGHAAPPGEPFYIHRSTRLRRSIQYAFDPAGHEAVVGATFAQELFARHEHGGAQVITNRRRKKRKIGDVGVIARERDSKQRKRKFDRTIERPFHDPHNTEGVAFATITSQRQLDRVSEMEEALFGPADGVMAHYPERPVMENVGTKHPDFINDALRDAGYGGY